MVFALAETGPDLLPYLEKIWLGFQVVFGVGLMIFIHELGHFLAAKKIGVRVEAFSLGFGPRLLGFKRQGTDYRLSAVPLGGYVKMAGENPDDPKTGSPDELQNRSPFERMVIFSAGVVLNFVFAFITMPIIFAIGVPFVNPSVGEVAPGGPAWKAGLLPGDKFIKINGNTIYGFNDIPLNIALGSRGKSRLLIERDGKQMEVDIVPQMNEEEGRLQIRIAPPIQDRIIVESDSSAERAGLKKGDRIVSIDGMPAKAWYEKERTPSDTPIALEVIRETEEGEVQLDLELIPEEIVSDERRLIGVMQRFNLILGLRGGLKNQPDGLEEGDFILTLQETPVFTRENYEALLNGLGTAPAVMEVLRGDQRKRVTIPPNLAGTLAEDMVVGPNGRSNSVVLMPSGALASLANPIVKDGMLIQGINGQKIETYLDILTTIQNSSEEVYTLDVASPEGDQNQRISVKPKPHRDRTYRLGFAPLFDYQTQKLNIPDAIKAGFNCSIYMVKTCYLTLHRMLITRDVSSKNLGGIITIARASYSFAELGIAKLFFFLAILSINLGFLNILPIPLLDGGHLMFLLIEKIKGSPVNERIMGYAQILGLAFILFLLLFVTWNDIQRLLR